MGFQWITWWHVLSKAFSVTWVSLSPNTGRKGDLWMLDTEEQEAQMLPSEYQPCGWLAWYTYTYTCIYLFIYLYIYIYIYIYFGVLNDFWFFLKSTFMWWESKWKSTSCWWCHYWTNKSGAVTNALCTVMKYDAALATWLLHL